MTSNTIKAIEDAFSEVLPPAGLDGSALDAEETRRLVDDLLVMRAPDLQWVLPQVLVDLLKFPDRPRANFDLMAVLQDLNVKRIGAEAFYSGMSHEDCEYYKKRFDDIRASRDKIYS